MYSFLNIIPSKIVQNCLIGRFISDLLTSKSNIKIQDLSVGIFICNSFLNR